MHEHRSSFPLSLLALNESTKLMLVNVQRLGTRTKGGEREIERVSRERDKEGKKRDRKWKYSSYSFIYNKLLI